VYPKVSGLSHNEIYTYIWYYSLRSNTKCYGGKTQSTDSQNSDTTTPSGIDLYHLQFSLQAANPESFEYSLVCSVSVNTYNYLTTQFNSRRPTTRGHLEMDTHPAPK